ncbi:hypothetical protein LTR70_007771 [Exophiala xenobiotica]|nr:hypothetical protein LTR70_007771 [Exophiala xenobiotica]
MAQTSNFPDEPYSKSFSDLLRSLAADLQPSETEDERLLPSGHRGPWSSTSNRIVAVYSMGDFDYGFSRLGLSLEVDSDLATVEGRMSILASHREPAYELPVLPRRLRATRFPELPNNRAKRLSIFSRLPSEIRVMILEYLSPRFSLGSELVEGFADVNSAARAVADITAGITNVDEVGRAEWNEELGTFCYTVYKKFPAAPFAWMQFHGLHPTWLYFSDIRGVMPPPSEVPVWDPVAYWNSMYEAAIADPRHPQFSQSAYERAWEGI